MGEGSSSRTTTPAPGESSPKPLKIAARSVDSSKLLKFLDDRFGEGKYHVVMQRDKFNIRAGSRLTDDEIQRNCYFDRHSP
ncbi:hypothetical protein RB595_010444 [Gaeumannomyces hyphopodioides]